MDAIKFTWEDQGRMQSSVRVNGLKGGVYLANSVHTADGTVNTWNWLIHEEDSVVALFQGDAPTRAAAEAFVEKQMTEYFASQSNARLVR